MATWWERGVGEDTGRILSRKNMDLDSSFRTKSTTRRNRNTHSVVAEETGIGVVTDAGLRN